jgi:hypothetical protein
MFLSNISAIPSSFNQEEKEEVVKSLRPFFPAVKGRGDSGYI